MGLIYPVEPGDITPYIIIACKSALEITCMDNFEESSIFCEYLKAGYLAQK